MKAKSITLSDIATKLDVSIVTVSKALRGHPDISSQMVKQIRKVADDMGYTPNFMARNLSSRKSNTIGLVVPKIAHHFFGAMIESIYNIAFKNNYEIILTVSHEDAEMERKHIQTLLSMRVDGIMISITQETKDYSIFETISKRGVPIVFVDRIPQIPNSNTVSVNDRGGAFKAVEHAIKLGYRNIAHFSGYPEINIGRQRYLGFEEAMKKYGVPINPEWVIQGGFGEKYGYNALMHLYQKNNLPDLIFTVTYPVALGVYSAARELNLKIPDDIDVICFGNARVQNFLSPPLSCINQPTDLLAEASMEILLDNLSTGEGFEPRSIEIETDLILRGTCVQFNREKNK